MSVNTNINSVVNNRRGGSGIPFKSDALVYLDGTILDDEGTKYFVDKISGKNFLITDYDFDTTWVKGFPYKSAATISAPAADATLIAADINNFLYDSGGTPNQIPVVSLFQDIDYEHKIFTKHVVQSLDSNGVEIIEPYVKEFVIYSSALTGADLTKAQSYYHVPDEVTENVAWVDVVNGSTEGTGVKDSPKANFAQAIAIISTGGTVYLKTGDLNEACSIVNKGVNIIGTGYAVNSNTLQPFSFTSNITDESEISNIYCPNATRPVRIEGTANVTVTRMNNTGTNPIRKVTLSGETSVSAKESILNGSCSINAKIFNVDTCLVPSLSIPFLIFYNIASKNNIYKGATSAIIQRSVGTDSMSFVGDTIKGSLFIDAAFATECDIIIDNCDIIGGKVVMINDASVINWVIKNNSVRDISFSGIFNIAGQSVEFTDNDIHDAYGYVLKSYAVAENKNIVISRNNIYTEQSDGCTIELFDYITQVDNNIIEATQGPVTIYLKADKYNAPVSIYKNRVVNRNNTSTFIYIGIEGTSDINNMMNGSVIYSNRFSGPGDYGNNPSPMHGLFSWNQSVEWYYNYLSGSYLGFVIKGSGAYDDLMHHNVIQKTSSGVTIKGIDGCKVYNNTFINTVVSLNGVPETLDGGANCANIGFKNNICVNITGEIIPIQFENADQIVGLECDYNIYYNPNQSAHAKIGSIRYTFAEWQALGYDTHSKVLTDAEFAGLFTDFDNNDFSLATSSVAIGAGETLDSAYDDGLDASTDWGDENTVPTVVTKQQGDNWDIGAYVS